MGKSKVDELEEKVQDFQKVNSVLQQELTTATAMIQVFQQSASEHTRHKADVAEGLLSDMEKMEKKLERLERDNSNLAHQKSDFKKQNKVLEDSWKNMSNKESVAEGLMSDMEKKLE